MTSTLIPISFALTPRMQAFIEFRDALRCLTQAMNSQSPYAWLASEKEVCEMLLGEGIKKPAIPNILSLFTSMSKHFDDLASKHPKFQENLLQACNGIEKNAEKIRQHVPPAINFLKSDAWLTAYTDAIRKQDPLGHELFLPQSIQVLWQGNGQHAKQLYVLLEPIIEAIEHLNSMLHAHVPWESHTATSGADQITLHAQDNIGLLIVGVPQTDIAQGILPICSGFRSIIRLRFSQWKPGEVAQDVQHDQPYSLMMVPIS
jgi:hypothetical protein